MKQELIILSKEETNPFYDESKANNGGGYSQPMYKFEFNGIQGEFHNSSCGDFGTRFSLDYDNHFAIWGTMNNESYSNFSIPKYSDFIEAVICKFGLEYFPLVNEEYVEIR